MCIYTIGELCNPANSTHYYEFTYTYTLLAFYNKKKSFYKSIVENTYVSSPVESLQEK